MDKLALCFTARSLCHYSQHEMKSSSRKITESRKRITLLKRRLTKRKLQKVAILLEHTLFLDCTITVNGVSVPLYLIGDSAYPLQTWLTLSRETRIIAPRAPPPPLSGQRRIIAPSKPLRHFVLLSSDRKLRALFL